MNDAKLLGGFLTFCLEKNFIDTLDVSQNEKASSYCYEYKSGDKFFRLYSNLVMSKVELQSGNEVVFLNNPEFSDVLRLISEKISFKKDVEVSPEIFSAGRGLGIKNKLQSAILYPTGIHENGIVYSDANGKTYLHQEEGKISLGFWKMFWDSGEEYSFLAMPKLFNVSSDLDYKPEKFQKQINSQYSDKEAMEYNYSIRNSVSDYLSKAYGRLFLVNNFQRKQYLVSGDETYDMSSILDSKMKDSLQWSIVSSTKEYLQSSKTWTLEKPQCVVLSGSKSGNDWKLGFSFRNIVHSCLDTDCISDWSVIMSHRDFEVFKDILSEKEDIQVTDNGVFTKLKNSVITDRAVIQKLQKLCFKAGVRQEIKSAKVDKPIIKNTFYVKVVDIDVSTKVPIVEVYKDSKFQIKEKMNVVLNRFKMDPGYTKFNELKFVDF
jgi:hypothetical protein